MSWQEYVKKGLHVAIRSKDPKQVASQLRHAARKAFKFGEKEIALQLIELSLDFSEGTNQYLLAFKDYHYYKTGEHLTDQTPKVQAPIPKDRLPWEQLQSFFTSL